MATITIGGNPIHTTGNLPVVGSKAPAFSLVANDLSHVSLENYAGKNIILNIFPSIDTGTCATSVRVFNEKAGTIPNTVVLCISRDLPFAQKRFCGAEGIENVVTLSDFNTASFGADYGLNMIDGPLAGLHSRAVVIVDTTGTVIYAEQVGEIAAEPNYEAALAAL